MSAVAELRPIAPATFLGWQDGCGVIPSFRLYNLTAPVGVHPVRSTISEMTLLAHGYELPAGGTPKPADIL